MRLEGDRTILMVGVKQTARAISEGNALKVYIAEDAEQHVVRRIYELAKRYQVKIERVESMKELGRIAGIDVGAASAVMINNQSL